MVIRQGKVIMIVLALMFSLTACKMIQEQTNREAPNQVQQREGRQEIKQGAEGKKEEGAKDSKK
ncbi:hypothetical protein [Ammoniphilus sp. CFH 90114]|uniref:hypothetical protein n=1 Tax=Ammoniphilus sp. CFH 90114 TaxID=2493665 RepID=UPI00100F84DA|nr:hypothetical protein [Ammoniphilus sp. CFH 90114]RXT15305.1 hypothetical protein EIZ39_03615 [Ammoniphilus sp. CFH 90114]